MRSTITVRLVSVSISLLAAAFLQFVLGPAALAHGQVSVVVSPSTVTAGDRVTLSVTGVEPDLERVIVLVGQGIVIQFPTVRTDSTGSFTTQVTVPAALPGGTYRFEAIGDETLTGDLDVKAAAGGIAAQAPADLSVPSSRSRSTPAMAGLVVLALLAIGLGVMLVLRAERLRGDATP